MQKTNSKKRPQSITAHGNSGTVDAKVFVEFLRDVGYGVEHGTIHSKGDKALHRFFLKVCERKGFNGCDTLDTLKIAFALSGGFSPINLTVHLHSHHVVQRHRRNMHVYEHAPNFYDSKYGIWSYQEGEPLNGNGHVTFCECAQCRQYGNYKDQA